MHNWQLIFRLYIEFLLQTSSYISHTTCYTIPNSSILQRQIQDVDNCFSLDFCFWIICNILLRSDGNHSLRTVGVHLRPMELVRCYSFGVLQCLLLYQSARVQDNLRFKWPKPEWWQDSKYCSRCWSHGSIHHYWDLLQDYLLLKDQLEVGTFVSVTFRSSKKCNSILNTFLLLGFLFCLNQCQARSQLWRCR